MTSVLPVQDYRILRQLFDRLRGSEEPLERMVREKLKTSRLLIPGEISAGLVRLGSRVRFQIAEAESEERTVVMRGDYRPDGRCLALESPLGVAVLGYQAGDVVDAEWRNECIECIAILNVWNPPSPASPGSGTVLPFRPKTNRLPNGDGPFAA